MFYVLVSGGRNYTNKDKVFYYLDKVVKAKKDIIIVHGGARGADSLASLFCAQNNIQEKIFNAEWDKYGKKAGYIRNLEMSNFLNNQRRLDNGIFALIFPGGRGTQNMHVLCIENKIPYYKIEQRNGHE